MAANAITAFGSYLRELRERRGLSLLQVARLTEAGPARIDKGTLSRLERGEQRAAASYIAPLGHIYDVPTEVMMERLELDFELARLGEPSTEGKSFTELQLLGKQALVDGFDKWKAYGYFRDALRILPDDVADNRFRSSEQGTAVARMNLATAARSLGRNRLALHELRHLLDAGDAGLRRNAILLDRISNCYRCLGDFDSAESYVNDAITEAAYFDEPRVLAFGLFTRGALAVDGLEFEEGISYLKRAFRAHREASGSRRLLPRNPTFEITTLLKLTDAYIRTQRFEKAKGSALAALKLSRRRDYLGGQAYGELMLGQLDEIEGLGDRAMQRWRRAAEIAGLVHNQRLAFAAEFQLFKQAASNADRALARASHKRLQRLAPWVPSHFCLLKEFKESGHGAPRSLRQTS